MKWPPDFNVNITLYIATHIHHNRTVSQRRPQRGGRNALQWGDVDGVMSKRARVDAPVRTHRKLCIYTRKHNTTHTHTIMLIIGSGRGELPFFPVAVCPFEWVVAASVSHNELTGSTRVASDMFSVRIVQRVLTTCGLWCWVA